MELLQSLPKELLEAIVTSISWENLPHLRLAWFLLHTYEYHWRYQFGEITSSLNRFTQFVMHSRKAS